MPPACAPAPPSPAAASTWAEMVAPLANMAESALAGGARTAASGPVMEVSGSDPRRVEGDPRPPGAHGRNIRPPVDQAAAHRASGIDQAAVRAGRAGRSAGLGPL